MDTLPDEQLRAKTREVYRRLLIAYGELPLVPRRDPMHELVSTMLSHRTTQRNEDIAFRQMWERFGSWEAIRDAPVAELAEAIAPSNFAEAKAPNIQKTLRRIFEERGESNLEFLREMPTDEALAWLVSLPGVGIKTASLVLLFCFTKPIMPVDTHLHRVSGRLGLIGPKASAEAAHAILFDLLDPKTSPPDPHVLYNFHIAMLKHGQKVCVWGTPRCGRCPLTDLCDWYHENGTPRKAEAS